MRTVVRSRRRTRITRKCDPRHGMMLWPACGLSLESEPGRARLKRLSAFETVPPLFPLGEDREAIASVQERAEPDPEKRSRSSLERRGLDLELYYPLSRLEVVGRAERRGSRVQGEPRGGGWSVLLRELCGGRYGGVRTSRVAASVILEPNIEKRLSQPPLSTSLSTREAPCRRPECTSPNRCAQRYAADK